MHEQLSETFGQCSIAKHYFWQVHLGAVLIWFILVKENNFSIQVARKSSLDNVSPPVHADACAAEFGRGACLLCFNELMLVGIYIFFKFRF